MASSALTPAPTPLLTMAARLSSAFLSFTEAARDAFNAPTSWAPDTARRNLSARVASGPKKLPLPSARSAKSAGVLIAFFFDAIKSFEM